jgi:uncharacterized protein YjiS (DUF1127 family)
MQQNRLFRQLFHPILVLPEFIGCRSFCWKVGIMNRNVWNERVDRNLTGATPAIGFDAIVHYAKQSAKAIRRHLTRMAIVRELSALDDRSLADIGINRAHIPAVADKAAGDSTAGVDFVTMVQNAVIVPLRLWRERAKAESELSRLTDRELLDIGIMRADIAGVVASMAAKHVVSALATPAASEPANLEHRSIQDVGVIRGDIVRMVDAVANRNQPRGAHPSAA